MTSLQIYIPKPGETFIRTDSAILETMWIGNRQRHIDYHLARFLIRIEIIRLRNLRSSPNWKEPSFHAWLNRQVHLRLERIRNIYRNRPAGRMMRLRMIARGQSRIGDAMVQI